MNVVMTLGDRGRVKCSHDITGIKVNGEPMLTWRDSVCALLGELFPRLESSVSPDGRAQGGEEIPPLRSCEIEESMARLRSRKSPGWDGMTGEMCKAIWQTIPSHVQCLFEYCFRKGYFPAFWKTTRVVVLLKSPEKDKSSPQSYRAISLLPAFGKVLERIMVQRLGVKTSHLTSDRQYGFRTGRSTDDALMHVKNLVVRCPSKYVFGIFVDFKGAFDYLSWSSVLSKIRECDCWELALWKSYFHGRKAFVQGVNERVWVNVERGCPQGSIAGPFIWNLMMDELLGELSSVASVALVLSSSSRLPNTCASLTRGPLKSVSRSQRRRPSG